jgi:hypothetical protein
VLGLVTGNLGDSASDPVGEASGLKVLGRELLEAGSQYWNLYILEKRDLLVGVEVVLQVLEGQGVVEDLADGQFNGCKK